MHRPRVGISPGRSSPLDQTMPRIPGHDRPMSRGIRLNSGNFMTDTLTRNRYQGNVGSNGAGCRAPVTVASARGIETPGWGFTLGWEFRSNERAMGLVLEGYVAFSLVKVWELIEKGARRDLFGNERFQGAGSHLRCRASRRTSRRESVEGAASKGRTNKRGSGRNRCLSDYCL